MKSAFFFSMAYFMLMLPLYASSQALSAEKIYKKVNDAIVKLYTYNDAGKEPSGQASGVILRNKAWIITNNHIMKNTTSIKVQHNEKTYEIDSIVSMDPDKDILILQMKNPGSIKKDKTIPDIKIGNSSQLHVGQKIYAIGSPRGLENTMTDGMVSGIRTDNNSDENLIQISAPISPGSSGGAIVNDKGELVGISSSFTASSQNLNFAIPINDVMAIAPGKNIGRGSPETYLTGLALAKYYYDKGVSSYMRRSYDSAVIYYKNAIAPSNKTKKATVYYSLGVAYHVQGKYDMAMDYYQKAIAQDPGYADAYYEIFQVYAIKGDLQKAVQNQMIAYRLRPDIQQHRVANFIYPPPY
jgi:tetratricopeptide (TPR) repeat protein